VNAGQDTHTRQHHTGRDLGRGHRAAEQSLTTGHIRQQATDVPRLPAGSPQLTWSALRLALRVVLWVTVLLELGLALFTVLGGHPGLLTGAPGCGSGLRLVADTVLAQGQTSQGGGGDPTQQFLGIVDRARQWLMWVLTAVVGLIIVFAGLRYAFAGGRIEEIEAAKRTLKTAVTGYLLAVLADSVVAVLRMIAGS
jgi:hypothetical protein